MELLMLFYLVLNPWQISDSISSAMGFKKKLSFDLKSRITNASDELLFERGRCGQGLIIECILNVRQKLGRVVSKHYVVEFWLIFF